jgi:hypothetical protein
VYVSKKACVEPSLDETAVLGMSLLAVGPNGAAASAPHERNVSPDHVLT